MNTLRNKRPSQGESGRLVQPQLIKQAAYSVRKKSCGNLVEMNFLALCTLSCPLGIKVTCMTRIKATEARAKLYKLLDQTAESHEPIQITGKRSNAILISEEDWRSIQETLYLLSIPGMRESIRKGLKTPVEKCSEKPGW